MSVRVAVTRRGPSFDAELRAVERRLTASSRRVGADVAKAGAKVIRDETRRRVGALRFAGYPLKVKGKPTARGDTVHVDWYGTPVGFWAMLESGTQPHQIKPRDEGSLWFGGRALEYVNHPGMRKMRVWSACERPLRRVVDDHLGDAYDAVFEV